MTNLCVDKKLPDYKLSTPQSMDQVSDNEAEVKELHAKIGKLAVEK